MLRKDLQKIIWKENICICRAICCHCYSFDLAMTISLLKSFTTVINLFTEKLIKKLLSSSLNCRQRKSPDQDWDQDQEQ